MLRKISPPPLSNRQSHSEPSLSTELKTRISRIQRLSKQQLGFEILPHPIILQTFRTARSDGYALHQGLKVSMRLISFHVSFGKL